MVGRRAGNDFRPELKKRKEDGVTPLPEMSYQVSQVISGTEGCNDITCPYDMNAHEQVLPLSVFPGQDQNMIVVLQ